MVQSEAAYEVRKPYRLPKRARRCVLLLHVFSSVGWLGLNLGFLALDVAVATTSSPATQHAAYRVMGLLGDVYLIPISWTALLTGLVLGLWTPWGLFRHRWVTVKLVLTALPVLLIMFSLLPGIHHAVAVVSGTPPDRLADVDPSGSLGAGCVSTTLYVTSLALSVFKPSLRRAS